MSECARRGTEGGSTVHTCVWQLTAAPQLRKATHCRAVDVTTCTARGRTCVSSPSTAALLMHVGFTARPAGRTQRASASGTCYGHAHWLRKGSNLPALVVDDLSA